MIKQALTNRGKLGLGAAALGAAGLGYGLYQHHKNKRSNQAQQLTQNFVDPQVPNQSYMLNAYNNQAAFLDQHLDELNHFMDQNSKKYFKKPLSVLTEAEWQVLYDAAVDSVIKKYNR